MHLHPGPSDGGLEFRTDLRDQRIKTLIHLGRRHVGKLRHGDIIEENNRGLKPQRKDLEKDNQYKSNLLGLRPLFFRSRQGKCSSTTLYERLKGDQYIHKYRSVLMALYHSIAIHTRL